MISKLLDNKILVGVALTLGIIGWFILGWVASASTIAYECKLMGQFYVGGTVYECDVARQPLTVPKTQPPTKPVNKPESV